MSRSRAFSLVLPVYVPSLLLSAGQGILVPTLPLFTQQQFEVNFSLVSLVVAGAGLGTLLGDVPAGMLIERWGRKPVMVAGTIAAAIATTITIGQMTMYIAVFRQGQGAVTNSLTAINGMYEDNLYLSNLVEYLDHKVPEASGDKTTGPDPTDGIRFENVSFFYPESKSAALNNLSLHIKAGESLAIVGENGSGKTTLIKLLTRLYSPTSGRILLEGLDLQEWDIEALRHKIGVIFQDFSRYQLKVGDNIGIGKDHTLFALTDGRVRFHDGKLGRKFCSVDMIAEAAE